MKIGFQNKLPLLTRSFDGRNCIVEEQLHFRDQYGTEYRTQTFINTDGGSIPPLGLIGGGIMAAGAGVQLWLGWLGLLLASVGFLVIGTGQVLKSFGQWWWSYIFHDALFQGKVEKWCHLEQKWQSYHPSEIKCNALLFAAMKTQGAPAWADFVVWMMLNWFGWRAFKADRSLRSLQTATMGKQRRQQSADSCGCRKCNPMLLPSTFRGMIVCPECGNKRCPHASDHDFACTDSNAPGQLGSFFK